MKTLKDINKAYIQGFLDGFNHSAEGYNGEYSGSSFDIDKAIKKEALKLLKNYKIENN
jgi:hypothetical protein